MGKSAKILLVNSQFFIKYTISLAVSFYLLASDLNAREIDARDYDQFFLWAGVKPQEVLDEASEVYIHWGELRFEIPQKAVELRGSVPEIKDKKIWLTMRVERIDWAEDIYSQLLNEIKQWDAKSDHFLGIQIDFDANTHELAQYVKFLSRLRELVPIKYKISITGVMDWLVVGDRNEFRKLVGVIDEVVIQTYQGVKTIEGYQKYLRKIGNFPIPYKIALVQSGIFEKGIIDESDEMFNGFVIFLTNEY